MYRRKRGRHPFTVSDTAYGGDARSTGAMIILQASYFFSTGFDKSFCSQRIKQIILQKKSARRLFAFVPESRAGSGESQKKGTMEVGACAASDLQII
jgi:hypothetical protein